MSWQAWRLDAFTWGWLVWLAFFLVWETSAIVAGYQGTLTAHLRPLWSSHPLAWWLAVGAWAWLGIHMLAPAAEHAIVDSVTK